MKTTYRKSYLSNGMTVASVYLPGMESVSIGFWLKVGGRYENPRHAGVSHFLEHLLFKGTEKRSSTDLKQAIEGIGGSFNAFTGEEYTCYLVKVLQKHLPIGIDILSDMVLHSTLPQEEVEKERLVILEEIKMDQDMPAHYVNELLNALLWPKHPLGMELAGTPKTMRSIRRKDIQAYRDFYYHPRNLTVVASGSVDHGKVVKEVKKYFEKVSGKKPSRYIPVKKRAPRIETHFAFKKTAQTHLALGMLALHRDHPDYRALSLLNVILGANMSSRLFQEVRENRGLAYDISSHLRRYQDTGALVVSAGVDSQKAQESLQVILAELERLKKEPVTQGEFQRAKEYYVGQLLFALEDTMEHMLWAGESLVTRGRIMTPEAVLNQISRLSPAVLQRVARRVIQNRAFKLALIGSGKKRDHERIKKVLQS